VYLVLHECESLAQRPCTPLCVPLAAPGFFSLATATTGIYTLSLHDALPISILSGGKSISGALGNALGVGAKGGLDAAGNIVVVGAPNIAESAINAAAAGLAAAPSIASQFGSQGAAQTGTAATGGGALPSDIVVSANLAPSVGIPGIGTGALTAAVNAAQPSGASGADRLQQLQEEPVASKDEIVVKAWNAGGDLSAAAAAAGVTTSVAQQIIQAAQTAGSADIRAIAQPEPLDLGLPVPVPSIPSGALQQITDTIPKIPEPVPEATSTDQIRVEARNEPTVPPVPVPTTTPTETTPSPKEQAKTDTTTTDKDKLTLTDLLKAAIIAEGLIGGGGGGGSGTSGTGTAGALNPTFTEKLPTTTFNVNPSPFGSLPAGYSGTAFGRGSLNAAADVPQYGGVLPPGFNPQTFEWLGPQKKAWGGYAEGGVDGPGDGRSDSIPAQLSDGEYVIDAETVALLGNGSSKAGARMLDQFRVNIRKDKGRHLAKGKFSVSAKRPESYLGAR